MRTFCGCADAVFAKELPLEVEELLSRDEATIKWGQWRLKPPGYVHTPMRAVSRLTDTLEHTSPLPDAGLPANPWELPGVEADAVPRELTGILLATTQRLLITGQGGCGKTYVTAKALLAAGIDFAIACPSNELTIHHANTIPGSRAFTYHCWHCRSPNQFQSGTPQPSGISSTASRASSSGTKPGWCRRRSSRS